MTDSTRAALARHYSQIAEHFARIAAIYLAPSSTGEPGQALRQAVGGPRAPQTLPAGPNGPECPKCGGDMWDNREGKRNPKAPDFACKDQACRSDGGVIWPPKQPGRPAGNRKAPPQKVGIDLGELAGLDLDEPIY